MSEDARESNTSFGYSGRHDHGLLPQLRNSGANAKLCCALNNAKEMCDKYLTEEIGKAIVNSSGSLQEHPKQKIKRQPSNQNRKKNRIDSDGPMPVDLELGGADRRDGGGLEGL